MSTRLGPVGIAVDRAYVAKKYYEGTKASLVIRIDPEIVVRAGIKKFSELSLMTFLKKRPLSFGVFYNVSFQTNPFDMVEIDHDGKLTGEETGELESLAKEIEERIKKGEFSESPIKFRMEDYFKRIK
jgi:hypothetical protein